MINESARAIETLANPRLEFPPPLHPTTANNSAQKWPVEDREKIPYQSMYNIHNLWYILNIMYCFNICINVYIILTKPHLKTNSFGSKMIICSPKIAYFNNLCLCWPNTALTGHFPRPQSTAWRKIIFPNISQIVRKKDWRRQQKNPNLISFLLSAGLSSYLCWYIHNCGEIAKFFIWSLSSGLNDTDFSYQILRLGRGSNNVIISWKKTNRFNGLLCKKAWIYAHTL